MTTESSKEVPVLLGENREGSPTSTGAPASDLLPPEIEGIIEELLWARYYDVVEGTVDAAREIIGRYIQ